MKEAYIKCLKKLREFRKSLNTENDLKRGKLYFTWIRDKTKKIENEKDIDYIYKNIVQYTLKNYKIDKYNYERLNKQLKNIVKNNYALKKNNYIFNNTNISKEDTMLLTKKVLLKIYISTLFSLLLFHSSALCVVFFRHADLTNVFICH